MKKTVVFAIFLSFFFFGCLEETKLVSSGTYEDNTGKIENPDSEEVSDADTEDTERPDSERPDSERPDWNDDSERPSSDDEGGNGGDGWNGEEDDPDEPNLYGTFRSNINNLVPNFHFGKLGFGAPFKCIICNIRPIDENYDTDMQKVWEMFKREDQ